MRSSGLWSGAEDLRFGAFVELSARLSFGRGEGLPGRCLEWGRPAWISDVALDGNFPRAAPFLGAGLGAAFAFPVSADGLPFLVMELLEGETLAAALARERVLSARRAVGHAVRPDAALLAEALSMLTPMVPDRALRPPEVAVVPAATTMTSGLHTTER